MTDSQLTSKLHALEAQKQLTEERRQVFRKQLAIGRVPDLMVLARLDALAVLYACEADKLEEMNQDYEQAVCEWQAEELLREQVGLEALTV